MLTTTVTPERRQHQREVLRTLADQIRFDLPLVKRDLQSTWQSIEPRLTTTLDPLDPLIEELRRFRNHVRHDAGANRTLTWS